MLAPRLSHIDPTRTFTAHVHWPDQALPMQTIFHPEDKVYVCPQGKTLTTTGTIQDGKTLLYRFSPWAPLPIYYIATPKQRRRIFSADPVSSSISKFVPVPASSLRIVANGSFRVAARIGALNLPLIGMASEG